MSFPDFPVLRWKNGHCEHHQNQEQFTLLISKFVQYPKKTILLQSCMWCPENHHGEFQVEPPNNHRLGTCFSHRGFRVEVFRHGPSYSMSPLGVCHSMPQAHSKTTYSWCFFPSWGYQIQGLSLEIAEHFEHKIGHENTKRVLITYVILLYAKVIVLQKTTTTTTTTTTMTTMTTTCSFKKNVI